MALWGDIYQISQIISGFATAGALIFVGNQFTQTREQLEQTREQTRIMQGRGWLGTSEENGISISDEGITIRLKNYGNVTSRIVQVKLLTEGLKALSPPRLLI